MALTIPPVGSLVLHTRLEEWPLVAPFQIAGHTFSVLHVLWIGLEKDGYVGEGEAAGEHYRGDTASSMIKQVESRRGSIEAGIDSLILQQTLPPGGARNAVDCALWDLTAQLMDRPVWQLAGIESPHPLLTTFGCGADAPEEMARVARDYTGARAIKLKLTGEPVDADRVLAVREVRPDVWLGVDANQGFTRSFLEHLMPVLLRARVSLIEQPLPVGQDSLLEDFQSPIAIAADESVQGLSGIAALARSFDVVNIKLDKCGGLTEALAMARAARLLGLDCMVGNMIGTSLAMALAFLVGQLCSVVDLDGPVFLKDDRPHRVTYHEGLLDCREMLWGYPSQAVRR